MATYVYTSSTAKLSDFMKKIKTAGIPNKMTIKHLESMGFKSKNHRPFVPILEALGFTSSNQPTERWKQYRGKPGIALAEGIREYYSDLFQLYPNAYQKDAEALRNYFSSNTTVGEGALGFIVRTFQTLCELAEFSDDSGGAFVGDSANAAPKKSPQVDALSSTGGPVVNLNIQLTLPEGADAETFEQFFAAMRKHLFDS